MTFATPVVLWGLLGPLLGAITLLLLAALRRRRAWTRWPGITRVVAIGSRVRPVSLGRGTRRPWLLLLALALALVALARPRWGTVEEPVFQKAREVMIALDLSRSMLVQDVPPSRLERSRLLVRSLLDGLRGERVGLIVFAGTAFVQVPMSTDYQILEEFLPELKPDTMPQGGSDYDGLLRSALTGFSDSSGTDRYLIVLSDGEAQDETWRKRLPAIKEKGFHVIALGVGTTAGGFIPDTKTGGYVKDQRGAVVLSRLEPATLQALAFETSGAYRDASAWVDLGALLQETIERGRQGAFAEKRAARAIERFQWFLFPALLFALLGVWRELPVRPRARSIRPASQPRPSGTSSSALGASVVSILALLAAAPAPARAAVEDRTPAAAIDRLRSTVTRLAAADSVAPAGWKAMAEQTLELAGEMRKAGEPLEPGLVHDALSAVDRGESIDPRAADWPRLREDLRRLLEPPPPEQQPEDEKQDEKNQDQQDKKDQQQQQSGQQGDPQNEQKQDQKQEASPQQQQQQQPSQPQKQDSALGELDQEQKQSQPPPQPQPQAKNEPPKTRKFGGKQDTEQKQPPDNPELAAALTRLEQVEDNDSPARLHQRIEEEARRQERQDAAPANPHDW